ncbi:MAG TPA: DUF397 domain-containing protein [Actinopolymorphaceae bacterium]
MKVDLSRARWRKASASVGMQQCVEVAGLGTQVAVRDSKDRQGPSLIFSASAWSAFVGGAKKGEYDLS